MVGLSPKNEYFISAKNSKLDQFMSSQIRENLQKFFVLGISYRKTALDVRGRFSLTQMDQEALLRDAKEYGIEGLIVLSTCNRTEIYAHTSDKDLVQKLFLNYCKETKKISDIMVIPLRGAIVLSTFMRFVPESILRLSVTFRLSVR